MKFYRSITQSKDRKKSHARKLKNSKVANPYSYSSYLQHDLQKSADLLNTLQNKKPDTEHEKLQNSMLTLQHIINKPKEDSLDSRANALKKNLGESESHQALRINRWTESVFCPSCKAKSIIQLPIEQQESAYNYKYKCLECENRFNDDSETEIAKGVPPIHLWMQCWYLLGCTNRSEIIAEKLGLEIKAVEQMIFDLQKSFKSKQPSLTTTKQSNWAQHKDLFRKKIAAVVAEKKNELYGGDIVRQAIDTNEERKQKVSKSSLIHKNKKF
ncbi:MAG: hypothetical protein HON32_06565 [Francisellaceae bacterium]|jgi:transposase-like protein|nr:hypothetical protein [Francisellaceae bacterium]MBT6539520.1 hypothetical protein [Francisellaceae bacterium]